MQTREDLYVDLLVFFLYIMFCFIILHNAIVIFCIIRYRAQFISRQFKAISIMSLVIGNDGGRGNKGGGLARLIIRNLDMENKKANSQNHELRNPFTGGGGIA